MKTRFDTLVRLRERAEEKSLTQLGVAQKKVVAAESAAEEAGARARMPHGGRMDAARWLVEETGHQRAELEAKRARRLADAAKAEAEQVRAKYTADYQSAEVVRRLAEARRVLTLKAHAKSEAKANDEAAVIAFTRKAG